MSHPVVSDLFRAAYFLYRISEWSVTKIRSLLFGRETQDSKVLQPTTEEIQRFGSVKVGDTERARRMFDHLDNNKLIIIFMILGTIICLLRVGTVSVDDVGNHTSVAPIIADRSSSMPLSASGLSILSPTNRSVLSGSQLFEARLENVTLSSYAMYWSVDDGQINPMSDNSSTGYKEASVNLSGWTWRDSGTNWGPYSVVFTAKDLSGTTIKIQTITVYVSKTATAISNISGSMDGVAISSSQPFNAYLENRPVSSRRMYWRVDKRQFDVSGDSNIGAITDCLGPSYCFLLGRLQRKTKAYPDGNKRVNLRL